MMERSDTVTQFLVACLTGRRELAAELKARHCGLVESLDHEDLELLPMYCWETNTDATAVRVMLDMGFPVNTTETKHGYSALHNAAWSGNAELVDLLISKGAAVDLVDPNHKSAPLDYALHCCIKVGRHPEGEYTHVIGALH